MLLMLLASALVAGMVVQAPERILREALASHESGNLMEAARGYEEYLSVAPPHPGVLSNLGAVRAAMGDYESAVESYRKALELEPDNATIRLNLGLAFYKAARLSEAADELDRVRRALPEDYRATLLFADIRFQQGEYRQVVETLEPLAERYRDDQAFAYLLGTALIREGRLAEGERYVDSILRHGDSAPAYLMLGSAHLVAGDLESAVSFLEKGASLEPDRPGIHSMLGRALLELKKPDQALEAFNRELEINPNDWDANFYLGSLLKERERFAEALEFLKRARLMRPDSNEADYQLAQVYLAAGDAPNARAILEALVEREPDSVESHASLASAYHRLGMGAEAQRQREIVVRLVSERDAREHEARRNAQRSGGDIPPEFRER